MQKISSLPVIEQIVCQYNLFYILYFRDQATVNCGLLPLWNTLPAGIEHGAGAVWRVTLGMNSKLYFLWERSQGMHRVTSQPNGFALKPGNQGT